MSHVSIPTAGMLRKNEIRLSMYRVQRRLGPVLMILGPIIALGYWFDSGFQPGRISAALNAGLIQFLLGALTLTLGCRGEQIAELKRRIAELEAEKRE
jgi:hypothetical protein